MSYDCSTIFRDDQYLDTFERLRLIPRPLCYWYAWDALRRVIPSSKSSVLDVGAGVGQFTEPFLEVAKILKNDIQLSQLEPSPAMRKRLESQSRDLGTTDSTILPYKLEAMISYDRTFDCILLSEVIHLFDDIPTQLKVVSSLSDSSTIVAARVGTREQVAARDWYQWYPEAREIDIRRSPSVEELETAFESAGFSLTKTSVDESRWLPQRVFRSLMLNRAYSSFRLTSDVLHEQQSQSMLHDTASRQYIWFQYEMTWIIAKQR